MTTPNDLRDAVRELAETLAYVCDEFRARDVRANDPDEAAQWAQRSRSLDALADHFRPAHPAAREEGFGVRFGWPIDTPPAAAPGEEDDEAKWSSVDHIRYWADAYSRRESGPHFWGHGFVAKLLQEYAAYREATAARLAAYDALAGRAKRELSEDKSHRAIHDSLMRITRDLAALHREGR